MKKLTLRSFLIIIQVIIVLVVLGTVYFSFVPKDRDLLFAVGKFFFRFFTMSPVMTVVSICLVLTVVIKLIMDIRYGRKDDDIPD